MEKSAQPKTTAGISRTEELMTTAYPPLPRPHWTLSDKPKVGSKAPSLDQVFQLYAAVRDHATMIRIALLQPNQKPPWK